MKWPAALNPFFGRKPALAAPQLSSPRSLAPVLFLDIDGVLHAYQNGSLERIGLIEDFLRRYPSVRVVISSNWRMQYSLEMLRELFADDVAMRIEGVTPVSSETPYSRHIEIREYVVTEAIVTWCALDDEEILFPPHCPTLVLTDHSVGVTEFELGRVANILGLR